MGINFFFLEHFDIEHVEVGVMIDHPAKIVFFDLLQIGEEKCQLRGLVLVCLVWQGVVVLEQHAW